MQAAVLHGARDLRVESRPAPDPGPGDVVVEVSHCGVCGTDLHMVIEGWGRPGTVGGHEWSGRVVAVGSEIDDVAVGAAVVGGPAVVCGTCAACLAASVGDELRPFLTRALANVRRLDCFAAGWRHSDRRLTGAGTA